MKVTVTILDERLNVKVSTSKIEVPVYHKVTNGGPEQIQSDFDQTDETAVDFIKNKPTIPSNAAQITVSDPVTPDFTPAVQGDNLQQVTNKVAGAQLKTLVDYTLTSPQHTIEFTKDDSGKPLTIYKSIIILMDIIGFQDKIGDALNGRIGIRFNDITTGYDWASYTNRGMIYITGATVPAQKGMVLLQINSNGFIGSSVSSSTSHSLINKQVVEPIVKVFFSTFDNTKLASIGSRIVILGQ